MGNTVRRLLIAAAMGLVCAASAQAATTTVTPASGTAGARVTLVGSGFPAGRTGTIALGPRRLRQVHTNRLGRFSASFAVPRRMRAGQKRLVAAVGRRRVANVFRVTARARPASSSMTASSNGRRALLSPIAAPAGTTLTIRGWGFPRRGLVRVSVAGVARSIFRASVRGTFSSRISAPAGAPGTRTVLLRAARATLQMPFRLVAAGGPPPPGPPPPPPPPPPGNARGSWTTKHSMPAAVLDAGGATLGGKLYAVGGKTNGDFHQRTLYVYTPASNSWTSGPDLPTAYPAVENPAAVAFSGKLYVFGGSTHAFSGAVRNAAAYTPGTGWQTLALMPTARAGATAQVFGGKIYVVGGMDGSGNSLASVLVYNPASDDWRSAPSLGTARDNPGSAVLKDKDGKLKLYVFGGRTRGVVDILKTVEVFDGSGWSSRAPMPTGRRTMAVGTLNGRAQLIGGERTPSGGAFSANEEYDPLTNSWRTLTAVPTGRHGMAAATIGGVVYTAGGATGTAASSYKSVNEAFSFG